MGGGVQENIDKAHFDPLVPMRRALPFDTDLHVRLGLARGFGAHGEKCYVMLNGVLW